MIKRIVKIGKLTANGATEIASDPVTSGGVALVSLMLGTMFGVVSLATLAICFIDFEFTWALLRFEITFMTISALCLIPAYSKGKEMEQEK